MVFFSGSFQDVFFGCVNAEKYGFYQDRMYCICSQQRVCFLSQKCVFASNYANSLTVGVDHCRSGFGCHITDVTSVEMKQSVEAEQLDALQPQALS